MMHHRRYGFLTEKTFKPIRAGHPFIVVGNDSLLHLLHLLGFETYSQCWDESYDNVIDDEARFNQTMQTSVGLIYNGFDYAKAKQIANRNMKVYGDLNHYRRLVQSWFIEPLLHAYFKC